MAILWWKKDAVMYTSEYGRTFYLPIRYDEETTNKLAMGSRGNIAPNLIDLVRLDKIYRVKQKTIHMQRHVFSHH